MQLGNIPIIVVNSAAAAKELFGTKGHALNSRPVFYTFHKVSIWSGTIGLDMGCVLTILCVDCCQNGRLYNRHVSNI